MQKTAHAYHTDHQAHKNKPTVSDIPKCHENAMIFPISSLKKLSLQIKEEYFSITIQTMPWTATDDYLAYNRLSPVFQNTIPCHTNNHPLGSNGTSKGILSRFFPAGTCHSPDIRRQKKQMRQKNLSSQEGIFSISTENSAKTSAIKKPP